MISPGLVEESLLRFLFLTVYSTHALSRFGHSTEEYCFQDGDDGAGAHMNSQQRHDFPLVVVVAIFKTE